MSMIEFHHFSEASNVISAMSECLKRDISFTLKWAETAYISDLEKQIVPGRQVLY